MTLETFATFRVHPNEHVDYMKAIPLSEVQFKEPTLALHKADDNGTLHVIEEAHNIPTNQILAELKGAEICIVEIHGDKVGYFIGNHTSGFYLGPEVDLEILRKEKPQIFETIKTAGTGIGGAQPQMQPQMATSPSVPGGDSVIQSGGLSQQDQMQGQIQGHSQGQPQHSQASTDAGGIANMSMDDLMAMVKAQRAKNQQDGGNEG